MAFTPVAWSTAYVSHFGSTMNGATIWWDASEDTYLKAHLYLNMYADPFIIDSVNSSPATCAANVDWTMCAEEDASISGSE